MKEQIANIVGTVGKWFIASAFIMWGWNTLAPHINCPLFGYWEIFSMYMALWFMPKPFVIKNERGNDDDL